MTKTEQLDVYNDTIKIDRLLQVYQLQAGGTSLTKALVEVGIAKNTFYAWIESGVFVQPMQAIREFAVQCIGQQVTEALPDMIRALAKEAQKPDTMQAKKLLWEIARGFIGVETSTRETPVGNIQLFIPQMVEFNVAEGRPAMSSGGHLVVDATPLAREGQA